MPPVVNKKDTHHNNVCEDLMRERAAVLSRAGNALSDALDALAALEYDIEVKIQITENLKMGENAEKSHREEALFAEVNGDIEKFNAERRKAQLKYYYFIVTREAMGLRRHDRVFEIYKLPEKKEKITGLLNGPI